MRIGLGNSDMTSYRHHSPQELHILSILAQTVSRQASGCLKIADSTDTWMLFLEQGKLVHASNSLAPFDRLDRYLRRLSTHIPSLASPVRVQVRLLFEKTIVTKSRHCWDYEAICWLVEQQYLTASQAAELVEVLAKDVLETLLPLQSGTYDLLAEGLLTEQPRFCQLDLRELVETCQVRRLRQRTNSQSHPTNSSKPATNSSSLPTGKLSLSPNLQLQQPTTQLDSTVSTVSQSVEAASTAPTAPPQSERQASSTVPKTTYTVACIDDSPTILNAIEAFLDDKAFKVLRIANPISALMQIIRNKPDLVLLDVTMPNLDGYELCSLLRRHPLFKQTPIIMVTSHTSLIDRAKAKLVGASGYLTKPFTQPDLLKIVFKHLK